MRKPDSVKKILVWSNIFAFKSPSSLKCVFVFVPALGCLSFTVQNDVCAEFDTRSLFSYSSAESGKFLCAQWQSDFKGRAYEHDLWHHKFGANCGPVCNLHTCDVETLVHIHWEWTLQWSRRHFASNSLTSEMKYICIFIDSGPCNEGEGVDVILRILTC